MGRRLLALGCLSVGIFATPTDYHSENYDYRYQGEDETYVPSEEEYYQAQQEEELPVYEGYYDESELDNYDTEIDHEIDIPLNFKVTDNDALLTDDEAGDDDYVLDDDEDDDEDDAIDDEDNDDVFDDDDFDDDYEKITIPQYKAVANEKYDDAEADQDFDSSSRFPNDKLERRKNLKIMAKKFVAWLALDEEMRDIERIMHNLYNETEDTLKASIPRVIKMTSQHFTNMVNDQLTQTQELLKSVDIMQVPGYKETNNAINRVLNQGVLSGTFYPLSGRVDFQRARDNLERAGQAAMDSAQAAVNSGQNAGERWRVLASKEVNKIPMSVDAWREVIENIAGPLLEDLQDYYISLFKTIEKEATDSAQEILEISADSIVNVMGREVNKLNQDREDDNKNEMDKNLGDKIVSITGGLFDLVNDTLSRQFNIKLGDRSVDKYKLQNLIVEKTRELEQRLTQAELSRKFTVPSIGADHIGKPLFSMEYLDEWKKSYKANLDDIMQKTVTLEKENLQKMFEIDFQEKLEQKKQHYEQKLREYIERQKKLRRAQWEKEQEEIRELQERLQREQIDYYDEY